jgi:lipopolysaccharide heptosyltransferase II
MRPIDPGDVRRILIRANNWIGDVVMISPAVRAIRARFPEARIGILARGWVLDVLRGGPFYDDLIEYDRDGYHRGSAGLFRLARELRRRRFDLAILFQKAFEAAALAFLAGARLRIGYATDLRRPLLTHPLAPPPRGTHHAEAFLGIARALGCSVDDTSPSFHLDEASRVRAREMLRAAGLADDQPLVALHAGASKPPRAWHADRFGALGRALADRAGASLFLVGDMAESPLLEGIAALIPSGRSLVQPPGMSLREMAAVLERCHLFVGNDSGPMHVAAALRVPTIGLFGPGDPERTAPLAAPGRLTVISRRYPCSPCRQDFFRECPAAPSGKPFCLEEIAVEEVAEAAIGLLRSAPRLAR